MKVHTAHDIASAARGRRTDLGWSQAMLAERAHVSRKWVSDFESGKQTVTMDTVLRVLDALGVGLATTSLEPGAPDDKDSREVDLADVLDDYLAR